MTFFLNWMPVFLYTYMSNYLYLSVINTISSLWHTNDIIPLCTCVHKIIKKLFQNTLIFKIHEPGCDAFCQVLHKNRQAS